MTTPSSPSALYQLASGTCYAPQCEVPATVFIDGEPFSKSKSHTYTDMLEQVTERISLQRDVAVDILAGVLVPSTGGVLTGQIDGGSGTLLGANPSVSGNDTVLALRLRNIGALEVNIESIDLHVSVGWDDDSAPPPAMTMMGRNDFPHQNPTLPMRVEGGASATWLVARGVLPSDG